MKSIQKLLAAAFLCTGMIALVSFTAVPAKKASTEELKGNISFKIVNDWGSDYSFCANDGHNTISKGTTKSMSFSEGTEIKYVEKGNCAATWFKVTSDMNNQTFKLTQLIK